jgi:hypothetical protein
VRSRCNRKCQRNSESDAALNPYEIEVKFVESPEEHCSLQAGKPMAASCDRCLAVANGNRNNVRRRKRGPMRQSNDVTLGDMAVSGL